MNTKKSHKFPPNGANEWKARGFKSSNAMTNTSAETYAVSNQEHGRSHNSSNFQVDTRETKSMSNAGKTRRSHVEYIKAEEDHVLNPPIGNKHKNIYSEHNEEPPQDSADLSGNSVKHLKKEKKKNVADGKLPETAGKGEEADESGTSKRKKQKFQGYTLFIGNLSYDTTKDDVFRHFSKCGVVKNVRIPLEKTTNEPRGFGYIEVEEHITYENVLSMHHTFLKRRRINVECTFGGSKTSQKRMALIKEKTLKLRFLSREGKISSAKQRPWGKFSIHTAIG